MTNHFALIDKLKAIPDYRKAKGRRHELWLLLVLSLLGTMCGYRGYRPLAEFCQTHWSTLCPKLEIPFETRMPSYSTFRRVLHQVDFKPLEVLFNEWVGEFISLSETTWVAGDGKAIKSTMSDYGESYQSFINTVSAYTHEQGLVLHLQIADNKQGSEQMVVEQLIQALAGQPVVFTFDALHCQKKTVQRIVNQGQQYLIALKANQKTLYQTVQRLHLQGQWLDQVTTEDNTHSRQAFRRVSVFAAPPECQSQWAGLTCLLWVERWGIRDGQSYSESLGYITNLRLSAQEFLTAIQRHWHIENRLHWVRDVLFDEDFSRPGDNAPVLWAILNCWLLNLVRSLDVRTVPQGLRRLANQVDFVWTILTQGFSLAK